MSKLVIKFAENAFGSFFFPDMSYSDKQGYTIIVYKSINYFALARTIFFSKFVNINDINALSIFFFFWIFKVPNFFKVRCNKPNSFLISFTKVKELKRNRKFVIPENEGSSVSCLPISKG